MYYQEKRTIVSVVSGVLLLAAYCAFALFKIQEGGVERLADLRFWGISMLIFIGVGIAAMVVIQIVFHIINAVVNEVKGQEQDATDTEDELDKLIVLKSSKFSANVLCIGIILALVSVVLRLPAAVMLNVLYLALNISCILEGCMQLRFYRRGIK